MFEKILIDYYEKFNSKEDLNAAFKDIETINETFTTLIDKISVETINENEDSIIEMI